MKFGSLFAGIGGIDLGLERAGMECAWQVEIDDYCTRVLEKHWPDVQRFGDVREQHGRFSHIMEADGCFGGCESCLPPVDLIAGGFPCQPHSVAGKRRGAEDDRNLWPEFIRFIRELKPRYVLAENVPGIISTYIDTVLSDLEGEGYTCAPFNLPAVAFDAPHRRERIFIVAYSAGVERETGSEREREVRTQLEDEREHDNSHGSGKASSEDMADASGRRYGPSQRAIRTRRNGPEHESWWTTEPDVGRVATRIPNRVERLRGLGNAVVPQVAEWIGRRIMEFDDQ